MSQYYVNLDTLKEFEAPAPYQRTAKIVFDQADDPTLPFCAGTFRLKPGQKGNPHTHDKEIEIYVVLQGEGTVTFNNETYPLSPRCMLYVPANTEHETVCTGDEDLVTMALFVPPIDFSFIKDGWKPI